MTAGDLRAILMSAGIPADSASFLLADSVYECCSADFVRDNWRAWLDARPLGLCFSEDVSGKLIRRRPLWMPEASDCDNLALGTMAWADTGNAIKAAQGQARGGLAYGMLVYIAGPARAQNYHVVGPHCINWFVTHARCLAFFEPGMGELVDLTPSERSSVCFGLAA